MSRSAASARTEGPEPLCSDAGGVGDGKAAPIIERRQRGLHQAAKLVQAMAQRAFGDDAVKLGIEIEKIDVPVFQIAGQLVPTAPALRSRIHDVESFLAEVNAQRPIVMLL